MLTAHRTYLLALLATVSAGVGDAQVSLKHPSPAPLLQVEWGAQADSVVARATRSGWTFSKIDGDSDYVFEGQVNGVPAVAFASFSASGGLSRVLLSVTPHNLVTQTYQGIVDTLRTHHGAAHLGDKQGGDQPAPTLHAAAAWPGILLGLRRDGWITLIFTCPEMSPRLPQRRGWYPIV